MPAVHLVRGIVSGYGTNRTLVMLPGEANAGQQ